MATVHDVAAYVLRRKGAMTTMKLQKLVYYSQAWSLVWDDAPLFAESIEAWANGPVCRELYARHRGQFMISTLERGDPEVLTQNQKETVDAVLTFYGDKSSQWLSDLTHREDPWLRARAGVGELERGESVISLASMQEYYSGLSLNA